MFEIVYFVVYDYDTVLLFKDYPLPASHSFFPAHKTYRRVNQSSALFQFNRNGMRSSSNGNYLTKVRKHRKIKWTKKTIFELKTIKFRCTHNKNEVVDHEKC